MEAKSTALAVSGLDKAYVGEKKSTVGAVRGVEFGVAEGEFFTLLGPSGCGKTTTLRCIAGLERPDRGTIVISGVTVSAGKLFVPPNRRDIGMVFQSYAIWPHMTVYDNVAYPLRVGRDRLARREIDQRVREALSTVALDGLEGRMATALSGGQQQRLALARALVRRPKLLLLDEPLSNLDAKLRERLRADIRKLQRGLGITTLYVTHDQSEALSMSNRIAVLNYGSIVQQGRPRAIYHNPETEFVASFVGASNFIEGTAIDATTIRTALGDRPVAAVCPAGTGAGDEVTLAIRRENVVVRRADGGNASAETNTYDGRVVECMFGGESLDAELRVGGHTLTARCHANQNLRVGEDAIVCLPRECCVVLTDDHGVSSPPVDADMDGSPRA